MAPLFYLGTPEPSWLRRAVRLPLFVSHRRLARKVAMPRATTPWALDSGGFNEITEHGGYRWSAREYVAAVARYDVEIGCLEWAAPQDWMCEPAALARTGLSVAEHQQRSVASFLELRELWPEFSDDTCPILPVLQGDERTTHLECVALFRAAGVDLEAQPGVGIGSVCRLERTGAIRAVVGELAAELPRAALHGFGVKSAGIAQVGHLLASADSQAWSMGAYRRDVRLPECTHASPNCTWCPRAALAWHRDVAGSSLAWFPEWGRAPWQRPAEV